jgi:pimeloyl-[acyl-carrier protein] methyl ester esterase
MAGPPFPRLHVTERGSGRPVLLLHGFGASGRSLEGLATALAGRCRVVVADLPGHGRSPPCPVPVALDDLGAGVAALLADLGIRRPRLLGWSLGAQAVLAAAARPDVDAAGLVLVSATPRFTAGDGWPHGLPPAQVDGLAARLRIHPGKALGRFSGSFFAAEELPPAARDEAIAVLQAEPPDVASALALLGALREGDLREVAPRVAAPTLLLHGDADVIVPPGASEALGGILPKARRVVLAGVGHAPFLSRPEDAAGAVETFLETVPP